jgi:hypothetical protein
MSRATPRPWKSGGCVVYGNDDGKGNGDWVADLAMTCREPDEIEANTDLIVQAVNSHDDLLEALIDLLEAARPHYHASATLPTAGAAAEAAIAKATGEDR